MRCLLLVFLGRDQEHLASGLASIAAAQHFMHQLDSEHTLTKCCVPSQARLQRLTEVAHICCVLKVLLDLGADAPLALSAINIGECYLTACSIKSSVLAMPCPWGFSIMQADCSAAQLVFSLQLAWKHLPHVGMTCLCLTCPRVSMHWAAADHIQALLFISPVA